MISVLRIRNFALIDSLEIRLNPGLNVFSGETGAGKSIIIDAVETVLGGRTSSEYVRTGSDGAFVEAEFDISDCEPVRKYLQGRGIDAGNLLTISREVSPSGRSSARLNGRPATATQLKELGGWLLDIHGQHEHQSLLRPETHIDVLDAFGGDGVGSLSREVSRLYTEMLGLEREIGDLLKGERDRARRLDILKYQLGEIDAVNPKPGEDTALAEEAEILRNVEKLKHGAMAAYSLLYEGRESAAVDILGSAADEVSSGASVDPVLTPLAESIREAEAIVKDAARELRAYAERLEGDQGRLSEIEARIDRIQSLKSKYGESIEEVLAFRNECAAEIERLENSEGLAQALENRLSGVRDSLGRAALALSQARKDAAVRFEPLVNTELEALGIGGRAFSIGFSVEEDPSGVEVGGRALAIGPRGADQVEFLIAPNAGEPPRPLSRIASGGELSRTMLALKSVIADVDRLPTVIFDEIDAGIGGSTARAVGERLAAIGKRRQVLCVTHLAHIACRAGTHFVIWKETDGKSTLTRAKPVTGPEREREIARMLGGSSDIALRHARELLEGARLSTD